MLAIVDRDRRILHATPALEQLLGRSARELLGLRFDELLQSPGSDAVPLVEAIHDADVRDVTLFFAVASGAVTSSNVRIVPTPEGSAAVVLSARDARTAHVEELAAVLDQLPDGFVAFDEKWRYTHVNRAAEAFYGRSRHELIGRVVWEVFPRARSPELDRALRDAITSRTAQWVEIHSAQFDRWLAYRVFPTSRGAAFLFHDTTRERAVREELRAREELQRAVFDSTLEGILVGAPDGRILEANEAALRILGRDLDELRRVGRHGVVKSEPRLHAFLDERRRNGRARAELTLVRGDGSEITARLSSAIFRGQGGEERTSILIADITEEQRAIEHRAFLAETATTLAATLDLDQMLESLAYLVVPGIADAFVVELDADDAPPRVAAAHRDVPGRWPLKQGLFPRVVERARAQNETITIETIDDDWLRGAGATDPGRELRGGAAMVLPLTEHGHAFGAMTLVWLAAHRFDRANAELVRALARQASVALDNAQTHCAAVEAKRLRDDVLGIVAHDLRNPLGVITLSAALLEGEADQKQVAAIQRSVARAEQLIEDLLLAAAIEGGRLPLDKHLQRVGPILEELRTVHAPLAMQKGLALEVHAPASLPHIEVDAHRVLQLLGNLVGNAIKLTPEGGRIDVSARRVGHTLDIEVRDTGPGIPADELPHLFDRFWQGARKRRGGAGLGLSIAKGITEAHGGTIHAASELGRGATFSVRFPLPRATQTPAAGATTR